MTDQRVMKAMALTGIVFALLYVLGLIVLGGDAPKEDASPEKVVSFFQDHQGGNNLAVLVILIAVLLLPFFGVSLRDTLREGSRPSGALADVAFAGIVVCASGLLGMAAIHFALVNAADNNQLEVARTLNVLDNKDFFFLIGGIAIVTLGTGLATIISPVLPRWLGWVSVVIGFLAVAGPLGFFAFFLFPVWVLVMSILLVRSISKPTLPSQPQ